MTPRRPEPGPTEPGQTGLTPMKLLKMKPLEMNSAGEPFSTKVQTSLLWLRDLAARLKQLGRLAARRVRSQPKVLWVRESAALGDRRFVSVVQFERQRFLIGSSASSVTLLSHLPDEVVVAAQNQGDESSGLKSSGEKSRQEPGEIL